ncbi:hypothetical protein N7447_008014 [Penicillium robsamsonii]|uniref:uncharacterized protein n=1 Tax=Penicillium robsamsonii TaxID=1792511 RepID=UPI00254977B1|nr:uncharacterized protein N7447_008014 [Penicillium robsamsonii]KAJ5818006.1 hypothetical protein N7447_008014 [Penicillium robsamsonii]
MTRLLHLSLRFCLAAAALNNPCLTRHPWKLRREALEADERYKVAIRISTKSAAFWKKKSSASSKYMEQCELDRLEAIKAMVLDFSGAISNPLGDLRYLLENYRTGGFVPKIQAYENYYGSVEEQTSVSTLKLEPVPTANVFPSW